MKRYFVAGKEISEAEKDEIVKKNTEYLNSGDTREWLKIKHIIVVDDGKEEKK